MRNGVRYGRNMGLEMHENVLHGPALRQVVRWTRELRQKNGKTTAETMTHVSSRSYRGILRKSRFQKIIISRDIKDDMSRHRFLGNEATKTCDPSVDTLESYALGKSSFMMI